MPKFQPKYSEEQKRAVTLAIVDGKMSARAACELAAKGHLLDPTDGKAMPSFVFHVGSARDLARKERNRRLAKGTGDLSRAERPLAAAAIVNRSLDMLDAELRVIEHQKPGHRADRPEKIARIARAAESVLKLERAVTGPSVPAPDNGKAKAVTPTTEAREIAREARKRSKAAEQPRAPSTTQEHEASGPRVATETSDELTGGD